MKCYLSRAKLSTKKIHMLFKIDNVLYNELMIEYSNLI